MARVAGESSEVQGLAQQLINVLNSMDEVHKKGKSLLDQLASTSKDKSYDTAEAVVEEVRSLAKAGIPDCKEVAGKLMEYAEFLRGLENG